MREAISLANENVRNGGGPFGAVIADKDGNIISTGVCVTANHDPTAHASKLSIGGTNGTFSLSDALSTSSRTLININGAIYWAHILAKIC